MGRVSDRQGSPPSGSGVVESQPEPDSINGDQINDSYNPDSSVEIASDTNVVDDASEDITAVEPERKENNFSHKPAYGALDSLDRKAYEEIKVYMDFITNRILPDYQKFDQLDHSHRLKVQYSDLWSLYRSGELVFQRDDSKANYSRKGVNNHRPDAGKPGGRRLWRICLITSEEISWEVDNPEDNDSDLRRNSMYKSEPITISAYYIDFDGTSYKGVSRIWTMNLFKGEKDITKLELYPVRFEKTTRRHFSNFKREARNSRFFFSKQILLWNTMV